MEYKWLNEYLTDQKTGTRSGRAGPRLFLMPFLRERQLDKGAKERL